MAFKFENLNNTENVEPSNDSSLLQRLGHAGVRGILNPIRLGKSALELVTSPIYNQIIKSMPEEVQQKIAERTQRENAGIEKNIGRFYSEQNAPQSTLESIGQRFLEGAPLTAAFGPANLLRSGIGSIAGGLLERGLNSPGLGDIGQLATEIGLGIVPKSAYAKAGNIGKKVGELTAEKVPTISRGIKSAQHIMESTPVKEYGGSAIKDAMKNVTDRLLTEPDQAVAKKINDTLELIDKNFTGKNINPLTASSIKAKINRASQELKPSVAAEYIEPLRKGFNDFFAMNYAQNPTFFDALNTRDRLTELKHMNSFIGRILEATPIVNQLPKKVLDKLDILRSPTRLFKGLATNQEARKHYFNVVKAIGTGDAGIIGKSLNRFIPFAEHYESAPQLKKGSHKQGSFTITIPQ